MAIIMHYSNVIARSSCSHGETKVRRAGHFGEDKDDPGAQAPANVPIIPPLYYYSDGELTEYEESTTMIRTTPGGPTTTCSSLCLDSNSSEDVCGRDHEAPPPLYSVMSVEAGGGSVENGVDNIHFPIALFSQRSCEDDNKEEYYYDKEESRHEKMREVEMQSKRRGQTWPFLLSLMCTCLIIILIGVISESILTPWSSDSLLEKYASKNKLSTNNSSFLLDSLGDSELCTSSSDCRMGCCSNAYSTSDGKLRCIPMVGDIDRNKLCTLNVSSSVPKGVTVQEPYIEII